MYRKIKGAPGFSIFFFYLIIEDFRAKCHFLFILSRIQHFFRNKMEIRVSAGDQNAKYIFSRNYKIKSPNPCAAYGLYTSDILPAAFSESFKITTNWCILYLLYIKQKTSPKWMVFHHLQMNCLHLEMSFLVFLVPPT